MTGRVFGLPMRAKMCVQALSLLLPALAVAAIVRKVLDVPPPTPLDVHLQPDGQRLGLTEARRRELFAQIADHDAEWWQRTERFADAWSRHDDYHVHLGRFVTELAVEHGLDETTLFLVYDEGVHRQWPGTAGRPLTPTWVVLKPRTQ
ncbi:MAG: hypothetical protein EXR79_03050 [Myxococcales bacterium]|nr:hypothetical protein [Myxococcales bacterium]